MSYCGWFYIGPPYIVHSPLSVDSSCIAKNEKFLIQTNISTRPMLYNRPRVCHQLTNFPPDQYCPHFSALSTTSDSKHFAKILCYSPQQLPNMLYSQTRVVGHDHGQPGERAAEPVREVVGGTLRWTSAFCPMHLEAGIASWGGGPLLRLLEVVIIKVNWVKIFDSGLQLSWTRWLGWSRVKYLQLTPGEIFSPTFLVPSYAWHFNFWALHPRQVATGPTSIGGRSSGRGREHQAGGGAEPEGPQEADWELAGWPDLSVLTSVDLL